MIQTRNGSKKLGVTLHPQRAYPNINTQVNSLMNDEAMQSYLNQDNVLNDTKENQLSFLPGPKDP